MEKMPKLFPGPVVYIFKNYQSNSQRNFWGTLWGRNVNTILKGAILQKKSGSMPKKFLEKSLYFLGIPSKIPSAYSSSSQFFLWILVEIAIQISLTTVGI